MSIFSKKSAQVKYVSIFEGRFELTADEKTPGAETRVTKSGKIKHFLAGPALDGFIKSIRIVKKEKYGFELQVRMLVKDDQAHDQVVMICSNAMSSFAQAFYKRMEGINWLKPVKIELFAKTRDGVTYTYCSVLQDGYRLPNLYQDEAEKAKIPAPIERIVNGQNQPDKTPPLLWWNDKIENVIQPQLEDKLTELLQDDDPDLITADDDDDDNGDQVSIIQLARKKEPAVNDDDDLPF